jgi:hypothetical protein
LAVVRRMSGAKDVRGLSVRIIAATRTSGTVGRVRRTKIAFGISTIDVLRFDEDLMSTNGTNFKGEVPMTHRVVRVLRLKLRKKGRAGDLSTVGGGRGYRRWAGKRGGWKGEAF